MQTKYEAGAVKARCVDCGAVTTYEPQDQSRDFGYVEQSRPWNVRV